MDFVRILTCALVVTRSDHVDSESGNLSNRGSIASAMNLKSLDEANAVISIIDSLELRRKANMVTALQHGVMELMTLDSVEIALLRPNVEKSINKDMNKPGSRLWHKAIKNHEFSRLLQSR